MMSSLSLKSHLDPYFGPAKAWDMYGYPAQLPVNAVTFVPFLRIFVAWDALLRYHEQLRQLSLRRTS